jgi:hypothetical protein
VRLLIEDDIVESGSAQVKAECQSRLASADYDHVFFSG